MPGRATPKKFAVGEGMGGGWQCLSSCPLKIMIQGGLEGTSWIVLSKILPVKSAKFFAPAKTCWNDPVRFTCIGEDKLPTSPPRALKVT